jgi:hypothetical protein
MNLEENRINEDIGSHMLDAKIEVDLNAESALNMGH